MTVHCTLFLATFRGMLRALSDATLRFDLALGVRRRHPRKSPKIESPSNVSRILRDDCAGHNCIGHNYAGHDYIGRTYTGHGYVGHNYIGHDYMGHNYIGHNNNYVGHNYRP